MSVRPREGGIKIVFDVHEDEVAVISRIVRDADFDVRRCYHPDDEHRRGGSAPDMIRLGAERPRTLFTEGETAQVEQAFDAVQRTAGFRCDRVGTDMRSAGGSNGDGPAGVREPRRPLPVQASGAAHADQPASF